MQELVIGNTTLEYTIRVSQRIKNKRVEITPGRIEVVVPGGTSPESITNFIEQKKNKIFSSYLQIEEKLNNINNYEPAHYVSGAKVLYRGRMEFLYVGKSDIKEVDIAYRNGFYIFYPGIISDSKKDEIIHQALEDWMKKKVEDDVRMFIRHYGNKLGLLPEGVRIKEQKHLWASCGKDRIININWQLIRFPQQVLEYVVIHELCHLKYRNHSKDFWILIGSLMPEYEQYLRILDKYGDYRV